MSVRSLLVCAGLLSIASCDGDRAVQPLEPSFSAGNPDLIYSSPTGGENHSCIRRQTISTNTSRILCWGDDVLGALGNSATFNGTVPSPVQVLNSGSFSQVEAGKMFNCATILPAGSPQYCWGTGASGELGDGGGTARGIPTRVLTTQSFKGISAGRNHACGITHQGLGYCWGRNDHGQLGINSLVDQSVPTPIYAGRVWHGISAGLYHTCGLEEQTFWVYCWGENNFGQLGIGDRVRRLYPHKVPGSFTKVRTGAEFSCGIGVDGWTRCWGNNAYMQVTQGGSLVLPFYPSPTNVGYQFTTIAVGAAFACGVLPTGAVYCWGRGDMGQLGNAPNPNRNPPRLVQTSHLFGEIEAGSFHIIGVNRSGSVVGWGRNVHGQLGIGTTADYVGPVVALP